MVIRACYERILSIIDRQFAISSATPGSVVGILFTGAQGNSKVSRLKLYYLNILILIIFIVSWHLIINNRRGAACT